MSTVIYNGAFLLLGLLYAPIFWMKAKRARDSKVLIRERQGHLDEKKKSVLSSKETLWIHAVSVGEVGVASKFIKSWREVHPEMSILLTTVTPTGQEAAEKIKDPFVMTSYIPFDLSWCVKSFLKGWRPIALLLVETEIWPNLIKQVSSENISIGMINARLSEKSRKRYSFIKPLVSSLMSKIDFVLSQTDDDRDRFKDIGVDCPKAISLGNIKFDESSEKPGEDIHRKIESWNISKTDSLWVVGSTHPGEDEFIINAFLKLKEKCSQIKMVLAPRHIERSESIRKLILQKTNKVSFSTQPKPNTDILILNELGLLKGFYYYADFVYLGGSLVSHGGQNPIEPLIYGKPILHGPHIFNFKKVYEMLQNSQAATLVKNEEELFLALCQLLENPQEAGQMGQRGYEKVKEFQGSSLRHVRWISDFMKERKLIS